MNKNDRSSRWKGGGITDNDLLWYWFVNIKGTGNVKRKLLLKEFGHPSIIYQASEKEISKFFGPKKLNCFLASRNMDKIREGYARLGRERTRFIHWESEDYPERLRYIPDPPYGFYLRGRLPDPNRPSISMVGSRRATGYGMQIASMFAARLAEKGIQIISGLAEGIDTASHQGAVRTGHYTLGILGGGIDTIYPRDNFNLYMEMYEQGGVLSEWNLGISSQPGMFPVRNRLISAMSDGVFVVEAARKSGTFITVDQALEQGKTVFSLPGRITDFNSTGTNQLIRDGAVPVLEPEDIIEYLETEGFVFDDSAVSITQNEMPGLFKKGNKGLEGDKEGTDNGEEHNRILSMIDERNPTGFSELMSRSGYDIGKLSHILYYLEEKGAIQQIQQNIYIKNLSMM